MTEFDDDCPPHIKLETAFSVYGGEIIQRAGMIAGTVWTLDDNKRAAIIRDSIIPDVKRALERLTQRIAEYEAQTTTAQAAE